MSELLSTGLATRIRRSSSTVPVLALAVFVAVYSGVNPSLLTRFQLQTSMQDITPLALVAMAEMLVVLTAGIDLSIAGLMCFADVVFVRVDMDHGVAIALAVTILLGAVCGTANGLLVAFLRLPTVVVTLASSFVFGALALEVMYAPGGVVTNGGLTVTTGELLPYVPIGFAWLLIIGGLLWFLLNRTVVGRSIYGIGSNSAAVQAGGLHPRLARITAFAAGGSTTSLAAVTLAGQSASGDPRVGVPYLLLGIAAVAVGGVSFSGGAGTLLGATCGATILALTGSLLFFAGITDAWQYIIGALIIVVAVALPRASDVVRFVRMRMGTS